MRRLNRILVLPLMAALAVGCSSVAPMVLAPSLGSDPLLWETWRDLHQLPVLDAKSQSLLQSSYCPDGCRYDRHSADGWRYLYVDGEEGVLFEEAGAGAITRIWVTMGEGGISVPLDPGVRLRVYIDGASDPVIDLPLPSLFDGSTPPFVAPLVGHRLESSGGNFSYVPIPYRKGCKVTLVGADAARIWFQFNFVRRSESHDIKSFDGTEDLSPLAALLESPGEDPWPAAPAMVEEGLVDLAPGASQPLGSWKGGGVITGLRLEAPAESWEQIDLLLRFDGELRARLSLSDFFAMGRGGAIPTRSLLVGRLGRWLYSYFPMPFFEDATIVLSNRTTESLDVRYWIRAERGLPHPESGLFGARVAATDATSVGLDYPLLALGGRGRVVGRFLELGSTEGQERDYLEGDDRGFVDGSRHPILYGTGVEDYFNGGFYFDQGPFGMALHGAPYTALPVDGLPTTAAYRIQLSDGATFENGYLEGLESGPTNNLSMRLRAVTWYYQRDARGGESGGHPVADEGLEHRLHTGGNHRLGELFVDGFESGTLTSWSRP